MFSGKNPFHREETGSVAQNNLVKNGLYDKSLTKRLSPQARTLLKGMFRSKPEERMTLQQVRESAWMMLGQVRESGNVTPRNLTPRERMCGNVTPRNLTQRERMCAREQVHWSSLQQDTQSDSRSNYSSGWATMPQRLEIINETKMTKPRNLNDCCSGGILKMLRDAARKV
jgi:hypothetical protein